MKFSFACCWRPNGSNSGVSDKLDTTDIALVLGNKVELDGTPSRDSALASTGHWNFTEQVTFRR